MGSAFRLLNGDCPAPAGTVIRRLEIVLSEALISVFRGQKSS